MNNDNIAESIAAQKYLANIEEFKQRLLVSNFSTDNTSQKISADNDNENNMNNINEDINNPSLMAKNACYLFNKNIDKSNKIHNSNTIIKIEPDKMDNSYIKNYHKKVNKYMNIKTIKSDDLNTTIDLKEDI